MGAQRDKCGAGARFGLIFSKTIRLGEESIGHKFVFTRGAPKGGLQPGSPPQTRNLKNTDLVDIISSVLRDLPFSQNQPLK